MAKFDELLEQTYGTLGETYGGASMAPGKDTKDGVVSPTELAALKTSKDPNHQKLAQDTEEEHEEVLDDAEADAKATT